MKYSFRHMCTYVQICTSHSMGSKKPCLVLAKKTVRWSLLILKTRTYWRPQHTLDGYWCAQSACCTFAVKVKQHHTVRSKHIQYHIKYTWKRFKETYMVCGIQVTIRKYENPNNNMTPSSCSRWSQVSCLSYVLIKNHCIKSGCRWLRRHCFASKTAV